MTITLKQSMNMLISLHLTLKLLWIVDTFFHILVDMDKILPMDLPNPRYTASLSRGKNLKKNVKIWNYVKCCRESKQFFDKIFTIFHNFQNLMFIAAGQLQNIDWVGV